MSGTPTNGLLQGTPDDEVAKRIEAEAFAAFDAGPIATPTDVIAAAVEVPAPTSNLVSSAATMHDVAERDEQPPQPYPLDALPPVLRAIVEHGAAAQGVDVAYWVVPMLGIIAGCVGATRRIRLSADWSEPAVLWTAVIAPSGAGKSPPLRAMAKPVRDVDYTMYLRTVAAQQRHEIEIEAHRKAKGDPASKPVAPPMLAAILGDATLEAVIYRASDNPRGLLVVVDELAGWLRGFDRYKTKGGDAQTWLSIHAAEAAKVDRKSTANGAPARIYVKHCAVSIVGTIQPGIARRYLGDAESREAGMAARLLIAAPPVVAAKWSDREVPPSATLDYERVVRSLLDLGLDGDGNPITLRIDEPAKAAFIEFHDANGQACADAANEGAEDLAAALSKLRGAAPRIALVLALAHAAEFGQAATLRCIGEDSMRAGITIARWFEGEARRLYAEWAAADAGTMGTASVYTPTAEAVLVGRLEDILRNGPHSMDDLHEATGRNLPAADLRAALEILRTGDRAEMVKETGPDGGRPREVWRLIGFSGATPPTGGVSS